MTFLRLENGLLLQVIQHFRFDQNFTKGLWGAPRVGRKWDKPCDTSSRKG